MGQERERALLRLLRTSRIGDLTNLRILEAGCGRAHRFLDWLRWGVDARNLIGIDLMG